MIRATIASNCSRGMLDSNCGSGLACDGGCGSGPASRSRTSADRLARALVGGLVLST